MHWLSRPYEARATIHTSVLRWVDGEEEEIYLEVTGTRIYEPATWLEPGCDDSEIEEIIDADTNRPWEGELSDQEYDRITRKIADACEKVVQDGGREKPDDLDYGDDGRSDYAYDPIIDL